MNEYPDIYISKMALIQEFHFLIKIVFDSGARATDAPSKL